MEYIKPGENKLAICLKDKLNYRIGLDIINEIKPFLTDNVNRIDVYCNGLEHISKDGMNALRHIKWESKAAMVLHGVAKNIHQIFILTLMDGYFILED